MKNNTHKHKWLIRTVIVYFIRNIFALHSLSTLSLPNLLERAGTETASSLLLKDVSNM